MTPHRADFSTPLRRCVSSLLLVASMLALASCDRAQPQRFTILQINDVYRVEGLEGGTVGGLARLRSLRKELEARGPVLVLHGGDALFPSVMSKYFAGEPMIDCLNLLDGDAAAFDSKLLLTFGNHEFEADLDVIKARLAESEFRWVTSNIYFKPAPQSAPVAFNSAFPNVHHSVVVEIGGLKVAVFGLTLSATERDYLHYDYAYGDAENRRNLRNATVRATLAGLREQAPDVVIALTHQDLSEDVQLATDFPQIDLIIGGHDHLAQEERVGRTLITKADADAKTAYVIDVDARDPSGVQVEASLRDVDGAIPRDEQVQGAVDEWVERLAAQVPGFSDVFGQTEHMLAGEEPRIRTSESAMGNWLADVVRDDLETDIGFVQGGAVRINENIPAGSEIRGEHLEGIFYFDDEVVAFDISGADIVTMLNNSVSRVQAGDGRFLQVSGVKFSYRTAPEAGQRQVDENMVQVKRRHAEDYAPLDAEAMYSVATMRHLWAEGARYGYGLFRAGIETDGEKGASPPLRPATKPGPRQWRRITTDWLAANERVTVGIEGRIVPVTAGEPENDS